jgi:16S rRNA (guanine(966)-N(2))-methyltransferase RsmD
MRIIAGKLGGRVLKVANNLPVRPTTDRTKESLFNIIGNHFDFEGLKVMDICCGTGNISIEFASRGAEFVLSVDKDKKCVLALKQLIKSLDLSEITVIQGDIEAVLKPNFLKFGLASQNIENESIDIIFIDPPYALPQQAEMVSKILKMNWLKPEGWLILEHSSILSFEDVEGFWDCRKYGSSSISFFSVAKEA